MVVVHVGDDALFRCVVCALGGLVRHGGCNACDQGGFGYSTRLIHLGALKSCRNDMGLQPALCCPCIIILPRPNVAMPFPGLVGDRLDA